MQAGYQGQAAPKRFFGIPVMYVLGAAGVVVAAVVTAVVAMEMDSDGGSPASTSSSTTVTASQQRLIDKLEQIEARADVGYNEQVTQDRADARTIEKLQQLDLRADGAAVVTSAAIPQVWTDDLLTAKMARLDAAADDGFCQSCFDAWLAQQEADERSDQRLIDKLNRLDGE
jgi:hypothetical protein